MNALGGSDGPLSTTDLAAREDFKLGEVRVSPSTRTVCGPGSTVEVEPRVMQVLVVLADARGRVVPRKTLFERCWGNVHVGDDSLNRTIGAIRKLAVEVAAGSFAVDTVPRIGYRLSVAGEAAAGLSRRLFIGGSAAAVAVAAAGARWWLNRPRGDPRFDALIDRGLTAIRNGDVPTDEQAVRDFRQAVAIRPKEGAVWGLLAYALVTASQSGPRAQAGNAVLAAQRAARRALQLAPRNPDALTALVLIERSPQDRAAVEDGLREVLAIAPDNPRAIFRLGRLLQGAGRTRESWQLDQRLFEIEPTGPNYQQIRALKLWNLGRSDEAQLASQSAIDLWPTHSLVRNARLMICAFTDRTHEALAIVDEEARKPILLSATGVSMWRASLAALEERTPSAIAAARKVNIEGARTSASLAAYGLLIMSALDELDAAFEIANGFLLGRGPVVLERSPGAEELWADAPAWRNTLGLFTPTAKAMRLDPRFKPLCDGLGLTEYWRKRGIGPDAFLFKA